MEKDGKTCLDAEKKDFDQQRVCKAPVCWLNYTTHIPLLCDYQKHLNKNFFPVRRDSIFLVGSHISRVKFTPD